jgi:DNA-directed RNA polymerase specialized sigma24 family protein
VKITCDNSIRIVASLEAKQHASDVQYDVYNSHRHRVFSLAFYMTGNELEAEEILTGTFIKAFQGATTPQVEQIDVALVGELRQRFPLRDGEQFQHPDGVPGTDAALAGRNVRRTDLEEAIQELPATERFLFLLRDVEGYQVDTISRLVDMPEPKVQRTLFSARLHLRQILAAMQGSQRRAA